MRIPTSSDDSANAYVASQPHLAMAGASRRVFSQLSTRRRILPALVVAVLLAGLIVSAAGYFGARSIAIQNAETNTSVGARAAQQMLLSQGGPLVAVGTTLAIGPSTAPVFLNNNTIAIRLLHTLSGQNVTIYALDGAKLTAIATDIANPQGQTALGIPLDAAPYSALVGQCGPSATSSACHQTFSGQAIIAGTDYITTVLPLFDAQGNFAGALATATPLSTVLAPATTFALLLAIITVLLAAIALVVGMIIFAPLNSAILRKLDGELTHVAAYAADLEHLSRAQVARTQRQERMARQTHDISRQLDGVLDALEQGQEALRDSTSEIWAGMSQPGAGLDPHDATRLARQAAISAGRIGATTLDARERCRSLVALMNQVIAEGHVLNQNGQQVEERAGALRQSIEQVEMTLGAQVVARQYDLPGQPFARRLSQVSRRIRGQMMPTPPAPQGRPSAADRQAAASGPLRAPVLAPRMPRQSGPLPAQQFVNWMSPNAPAIGSAFGGMAGMSYPGVRGNGGARPAGGTASRPFAQPMPWSASEPHASGPHPSSPRNMPGTPQNSFNGLPGNPYGPPGSGFSAAGLAGLNTLQEFAGLGGQGNASGYNRNPTPGNITPGRFSGSDGLDELGTSGVHAPTPTPRPASLSQPRGYIPWLQMQDEPTLTPPPGQLGAFPASGAGAAPGGPGVPWAPWLSNLSEAAAGGPGDSSPTHQEPGTDNATRTPPDNDWMLGKATPPNGAAAPRTPERGAPQPPREPPDSEWVND